ncbi:hypothetical protein [Herbiconiux sp. VKM Ac-2851]|uniref:hypothetical protein n=1 Tax=Herbiconiux sp. VKM Ac-2851 TaxID=2739025 RepID=UPI001564CC35|nr:hypothetical protein [Herbiconiux sp. VKM Ac-2851]NQX33585.1 hypothetical protein [Herbiconiux sp. VKM Ac-2851]
MTKKKFYALVNDGVWGESFLIVEPTKPQGAFASTGVVIEKMAGDTWTLRPLEPAPDRKVRPIYVDLFESSEKALAAYAKSPEAESS